MEEGQLLTSTQVAEALGISEEEARMAMRRYAGPGTVRTNDRRWFTPAENLAELRRAIQGE
jgi:DNA-binding GntR family transcriptional regulator